MRIPIMPQGRRTGDGMHLIWHMVICRGFLKLRRGGRGRVVNPAGLGVSSGD